jgi:enterochelin esterase-like enzyme
MKRTHAFESLLRLGIILCVVNLLIACSTFKPAMAAKRPQPPVSPEIKEGNVTFRFSAPRAKEVNLVFPGMTNLAMQKDPKGVWSVTVDKLAPELYEYNFNVDGVSTLDPGNPAVKLGLRTTHSLLEMPDNPPSFFAVRDVPHGTVAIHTFESKALGRMRQVEVYTPPGYNEHPERRYPVLYLLHGGGDDERGWPVVGRAPEIADNLLADKKAGPMLIVMPNVSYPDPEGAGMANCETDLLDVIMPLVESNYRVQADAEHRALAGLSMGAGQTLAIGVKHTELFHWLGVFSNGVNENYAHTHGAYLDTANERLSLLWIALGEKDSLMKDYLTLEKILQDKGVRHISKITPGGHTWRNWRRYLNEFLPLLFTKGVGCEDDLACQPGEIAL